MSPRLPPELLDAVIDTYTSCKRVVQVNCKLESTEDNIPSLIFELTEPFLERHNILLSLQGKATIQPNTAAAISHCTASIAAHPENTVYIANAIQLLDEVESKGITVVAGGGHRYIRNIAINFDNIDDSVEVWKQRCNLKRLEFEFKSLKRIYVMHDADNIALRYAEELVTGLNIVFTIQEKQHLLQTHQFIVEYIRRRNLFEAVKWVARSVDGLINNCQGVVGRWKGSIYT